MSDTTISRITDKILPIAREWQNRPLKSVYAVVFMDAIHYHVRSEGQIVKKAVYIAIGVNLDGRKHLFDIIDEEADFSRYRMLILPDQILLCDALGGRLRAYLENGGRVMLSGCSGLNMARNAFALDVGADFGGFSQLRPDYMVPDFETVNGRTEYVMYSQGVLLENVAGEVFAHRQAPYFNRGAFHFSSHQHTPNDVSAPLLPAAVLHGNVAYIGWNIFEDYAVKGELIARELVLYAVERLLGDNRTLRTSLPDRGVATVTRQENREIVHLLFASTSVRGKGIEVIEDAVPLRDVQVSLKTDALPKRICLAPQGDALPFEWKDGRAEFIVPEVTLHQMIAVEH